MTRPSGLMPHSPLAPDTPDRTPDDLDRASDLEALERASVIALAHACFVEDEARRLRAAESGVCGNCGRQGPAGHRYCDADCRNDHEARLRARLRNGSPNHHEDSHDDT